MGFRILLSLFLFASAWHINQIAKLRREVKVMKFVVEAMVNRETEATRELLKEMIEEVG